MKCLKCNSNAKESQYNSLTGYSSFRCVNPDCNYLFDKKELQNNSLSDGVHPIYSQSYSRRIRVKDSEKKLHLEKLNKIENIFGTRIINEVFNKATLRPHFLTKGKMDQKLYQLSSGEKYIADFILNLWNPHEFPWDISNIQKLDNLNRKRILDMMHNLSSYQF